MQTIYYFYPSSSAFILFFFRCLVPYRRLSLIPDHRYVAASQAFFSFLYCIKSKILYKFLTVLLPTFLFYTLVTVSVIVTVTATFVVIPMAHSIISEMCMLS